MPVVKGFTIEVDHGDEPLNYYEKYKSGINDENCIIYVQTNNIKDANKKMQDLYYKLIIKAMNNQLATQDKMIKRKLKEMKKN